MRPLECVVEWAQKLGFPPPKRTASGGALLTSICGSDPVKGRRYGHGLEFGAEGSC
jgi:hypothetical protein